MCGIVAIFSQSTPIAQESLVRATQRLVHRGPDEQQHWMAAHRRVGLGHTRLSIIDLLTGTQPIASEDEQLRIVVNGEFYDFERIRRDLEARGHQFRTRSDSEIALHLYEEMGAKCLEHLRGEFAFVIWDDANETLFAARDRFGIKPLFYARVGATLFLASEVKALFAAGVGAAWDQESVFQNLFLSVDQDRTLFKDVRQVPPGHYLVARSDSFRLASYWDVDYPRTADESVYESETQCVEQARCLLNEAVRLRMRADVPVGCYLSGGVDSSAVLGLARTHANGRLAAFTVAFDHPDYDESASARRTAAHVGAEFWPVAVTDADFADVFSEAVWQGEMVHYNAHGAARYKLSRAVQKAGYKVVLAGEGADELFAGYDFSSQALVSSGNRGLAKWAGLVFRLMSRKNPTERCIESTSPWLARTSRVLNFPPALLEYVAEKFVLLKSLLSEDFAEEFQNRDPYKEFFGQIDWRSNLAGRHPVKQILYLWMKSLFVNYVLAGERLDMAHAVEVRLPFLDHKVFEFARSIPAPMLARNGQQKYVLREAAKPFITEEVYRGAKQPFFAPPTTLRVGNPMYELLQDLLRSQSSTSVPFFNRTTVVRLLDDLSTMDELTRTSMDPALFMMASICVLHERYGL